MKTLKTLAVITMTGTLLGFGAGTFAGDTLPKSIEMQSRVVTFYDLDLAQPADAQKLLKRIQNAAENVCRKSSVNTMDMYANIDMNRCLNTSYRDTVAQVDRRFNTSIEKIAGMAQEQQELVSKR